MPPAPFSVSHLLVLCSFAALAAALPVQSAALSDAPENAGTNAVTASGASSRTNNPTARIRDEGLNHSQVMQTLSYLTDVIGPRLTGSPNLKRANEWTQNKLSGWGLSNAHLEPWGPFGRGWSLKRFSAQIVEPQGIPLDSFPKAWSSGTEYPITGNVVHLNAKTEVDLERYKGNLNGAIVLVSAEREVKARFEPLASRMSESNLLRMANAGEARTGFARTITNRVTSTNATDAGSGTNRASARSPLTPGRVLSFLMKEKAAVMVSASSEGDAGTLFVSSASIPGESTGRGATNSLHAWSTNAPASLPQFTLAVEQYNRLVRMLRQGEKLKMEVDLKVQFHDQDLMAYNTIAEIPGTDLKDELVMLGAHMDSWHSGTGATDNGAGVAAAMEAVRILQALKLQPRRTIRIGLWTGEEEGLLGSRAYVRKHFGYYTNITNSSVLRSPRDQEDAPRPRSSRSPARGTFVRGPEFEKFCAYFNVDHGTGKIRGIYIEGNEAVRPIFRRWLAPFADLGAETITFAATGGTDHVSFDSIGLPAFQFIQDPIDYWTRTHHSNADVFERIQPDDLKQTSIIFAAFVYDAAMADQKIPRKITAAN